MTFTSTSEFIGASPRSVNRANAAKWALTDLAPDLTAPVHRVELLARRRGNDMGFRWLGLSDDVDSVVVRRFDGNFNGITKKAAAPERIARGVVVDVESFGLLLEDPIIEIALRPFSYDKSEGVLVDISEPYVARQDPGRPLPPEIVALTGLTDADLQGQSIDAARVDQILADAQLAIAHNAAFDRPRVERFLVDKLKAPRAMEVAWACSFEDVDWKGHGLPAQKLEVLCVFHGFFSAAHRALSDVDALLKLLSLRNAESEETYLKELLRNARTPVGELSVWSDYEDRHALKRRAYRWSPSDKSWRKVVGVQDRATEEDWLRSNLSARRLSFKFQPIKANERFRKAASEE